MWWTMSCMRWLGWLADGVISIQENRLRARRHRSGIDRRRRLPSAWQDRRCLQAIRVLTGTIGRANSRASSSVLDTNWRFRNNPRAQLAASHSGARSRHASMGNFSSNHRPGDRLAARRLGRRARRWCSRCERRCGGERDGERDMRAERAEFCRRVEATARAARASKAIADWSGWRPFRVAAIVDEAHDVKSFYFTPVDGRPLSPFAPGQYLTFRLAAAGRQRAARAMLFAFGSAAAGLLPRDDQANCRAGGAARVAARPRQQFLSRPRAGGRRAGRARAGRHVSHRSAGDASRSC